MKNKHGITVVEFIVVVFIILIIASIFFPVFAHDDHGIRTKTCTSQLRQLATAMQMYCQDNGDKYPGCLATPNTWDVQISRYVGKKAIFHCPSDKNTDSKMVSYAYSALLVHPDGSGINASQLTSPADTGLLCDADNSAPFGGLVGGGAGLGTDYTRTPSPRHSGCIVAYGDGHAKFAPGTILNDHDMSSPVNRAFFMASSLGWVDNPGSGLGQQWKNNAIAGSNLLIGGDYCTRPLLRAAAELWKYNGHADYQMTDWTGQNEPTSYASLKKKPDGWVYGCGDNGVLTGADPARHCIGSDAVVFIVSVNSKISVSPYDGTAPYYIGRIASGDYATNISCLTAMWSNSVGFSATSALCYQVYDMNARAGNTYLSGTRAFIISKLGLSRTKFGKAQQQAITVNNDKEMVKKIAADPYGIGYCSAAFADTNQVMILGIAGGKTPVSLYTQPNQQDGLYATGVQLYPTCDQKKRWIVPEQPAWPFMRNLYIKFSSGGAHQPAHTFAVDVIKGGSLNNLLLSSPLFRASYYKP